MEPRDIAKEDRDLRKPVIVTRAKMLIIYLSMFLMLAASVSFSVYLLSSYQAEQAEQAANAIRPVCDYLSVQIEVYNETPPSTPTGVKLKVAIDDLYQTYQCSKYSRG